LVQTQNCDFKLRICVGSKFGLQLLCVFWWFFNNRVNLISAHNLNINLFFGISSCTIIVHGHLPYFLRYDIFQFSSSKSFQTGCRCLASFSPSVVSSPKQAAVTFTPAFISRQYSTLFQEVWYFLILSPWSDPSFTFLNKASLPHK